MGLGQIVMALLMVGLLAGYWWFKVGRLGGTDGYIRTKLGLRDGENIAAMWTCYWDIDRTTGEKVGEVLGVRTRGINVMLALTTLGRLAIGDNEKDNPPLGFERGSVSVAEHPNRAEVGTLAGPQGLEPALVMQLTPAQGQPFRLQIARSGFEAVQAWARGG